MKFVFLFVYVFIQQNDYETRVQGYNKQRNKSKEIRKTTSEDLKASRRKSNFGDVILFSPSCEYKYRVRLKCDAVLSADSV